MWLNLRRKAQATWPYDFNIWQAELASYPSELTNQIGSPWAVWYDASLDVNYLYNPWWANDIIRLREADIWLDISNTSEIVIQFYCPTQVGELWVWFLNFSSYGWAIVYNMSSRKWRQYRRLDTRWPNYIDATDSWVVIPATSLNTLYEIRLLVPAQWSAVLMKSDIRAVWWEWDQWYSYQAPTYLPSGFTGVPNAFWIASGKHSAWWQDAMRITHIGINEVAV